MSRKKPRQPANKPLTPGPAQWYIENKARVKRDLPRYTLPEKLSPEAQAIADGIRAKRKAEGDYRPRPRKTVKPQASEAEPDEPEHARNELFNEVLDKNKGWLEHIARRYTDQRHDEDDCYQEISIAILKAIPRHNGRRGASIHTYIKNIAYKVAISFLRKRLRFGLVGQTHLEYGIEADDLGFGDTQSAVSSKVTIPEGTTWVGGRGGHYAGDAPKKGRPRLSIHPNSYMRGTLLNICGGGPEHLEALIEKLQPKDREIINLRLKRYSHKQIAERLGLDSSTVRQRFLRAKKRLKKLFSEK